MTECTIYKTLFIDYEILITQSKYLKIKYLISKFMVYILVNRTVTPSIPPHFEKNLFNYIIIYFIYDIKCHVVDLYLKQNI